jgi:hypothetical protein
VFLFLLIFFLLIFLPRAHSLCLCCFGSLLFSFFFCWCARPRCLTHFFNFPFAAGLSLELWLLLYQP